MAQTAFVQLLGFINLKIFSISYIIYTLYNILWSWFCVCDRTGCSPTLVWLWHQRGGRVEAPSPAYRVLVSSLSPTVCCWVRLYNYTPLNAHTQSWLLQASNADFQLHNAKYNSNYCKLQLNFNLWESKTAIFSWVCGLHCLWAPHIAGSAS